jgi:uncharacterized protein YjiS (DUF1127 family)
MTIYRNNTDFGVASRIARSAAPLGRILARRILVRATRRALNELPDDLLSDIGLTRSDISFVVDAIASEGPHLTRDTLHRCSEAVGQRSAVELSPGGLRFVLVSVVAVWAFVALSCVALAE